MKMFSPQVAVRNIEIVVMCGDAFRRNRGGAAHRDSSFESDEAVESATAPTSAPVLKLPAAVESTADPAGAAKIPSRNFAIDCAAN
jgi:hypothetical protein